MNSRAHHANILGLALLTLSLLLALSLLCNTSLLIRNATLLLIAKALLLGSNGFEADALLLTLRSLNRRELLRNLDASMMMLLIMRHTYTSLLSLTLFTLASLLLLLCPTNTCMLLLDLAPNLVLARSFALTLGLFDRFELHCLALCNLIAK